MRSLVVALLAFGLYLSTLSHNYAADGLLYAMAVESGELRAVVDPYHLLLHPLGWFNYQIWQELGWRGGSLLSLQTINAFGGAACVGLVHAITLRLTRSSRIAAVIAGGLAVSGGAWLLSTHAEFVSLPLAAALLVLFGLFSAHLFETKPTRYALVLGLGTALAILVYLSNFALVPTTLLASYWLEEPLSQKRRSLTLVYLGTVAILAIPSVLGSSIYAVSGDWRILFKLFASNTYTRFSLLDLPRGAYAFLRSLALYPNLLTNDRTLDFLGQASYDEIALFAAYYAILLIIASLPVLALWIRWKRRLALSRSDQRAILILLTWSGLHAVFAFLWVPGDISFWLPVLTAWWLLAGLALKSAAQKPVGNSKWKSIYTSAWVLVVFLALANAGFAILPNRDLGRNEDYELAAQISAHSGLNDLILIDAQERLWLYSAYFTRRHTFPLYPGRNAKTQAILDRELSQAMDRAISRGGKIFFVTRRPGSTQQMGVYPSYHLLPESVTPEPAWESTGLAGWEVSP